MIRTDFDSNLEGWTATNGTATWETGAARAQEGGSATYYFVAPEEYTGNLLAYFGGTLTYLLRVNTTGVTSGLTNDVAITGGGLTIYADIPLDPGPFFQFFDVTFDSGGGWRIGSATGPLATDDDIQRVLVDVTSFQIRGEYVTGSVGDVALLSRVVVDFPEDRPFSGRVIESDFNENFDGWGFVGDVLALERFGTLGASGEIGDGYLRATDAELGPIFYFDAPDTYVGNRAAFYGGTLSYDFRVSGTGAFVTDRSDVELIGAGLVLEYWFDDDPTSVWQEFSVSLSTASGWIVAGTGLLATEAQILAVLTDLEALRIRGEYTQGLDQARLDNVRMEAPVFPTGVSVLEDVETGGFLGSNTTFAGIQEYLQEGAFVYIFDASAIASGRQAIDFNELTIRVGNIDGQFRISDEAGSDGEITFIGTGDVDVIGNASDNRINGASGDDVLRGGAGQDLLFGSFGDDTIFGATGVDFLIGGGGRDLILGGAGSDSLDGGAGRDTLFGEGSPDTILGGDGFDVLRGGAGGDTLVGGQGRDSLFGDDGNDRIYGDEGFSTISGDNTFGDFIRGGDGDDTVRGSGQRDFIYGEDGDDELFGNDGGDLIRGGAGNDEIIGGQFLGDGDDTIYGEAGDDTIDGGGGDDRINGGGDNDFIRGLEGNDRVFGLSGNDTLSGDNGDDSIFGGAGQDEIFGGADDDSVNGGSGHDRIDGSTGQDTLIGDNGRDTIFGGSGNDEIFGGGDEDSIRGGVGADTIRGGSGDDSLLGDNLSLNNDDGDDVIFGNAGNDQIFGSGGSDFMSGGSGNDTITSDGRGSDTLVGGSGNDVLSDFSFEADEFRFGAGMGQDTVEGFNTNVADDGLTQSDVLVFDRALITNPFTIVQDGQDLLDEFAQLVSGGVLIDFGDGNSVLLIGVDDLAALADDIVLVG